MEFDTYIFCPGDLHKAQWFFAEVDFSVRGVMAHNDVVLKCNPYHFFVKCNRSHCRGWIIRIIQKDQPCFPQYAPGYYVKVRQEVILFCERHGKALSRCKQR